MGFGNPAAERLAVEATYEDTMTIRRDMPAPAGNTTKMVPQDLLAGVICALSRGGGNSRQTAAQQSIEHDAVVFCAPELDIQPGDTLQVRRFGRDNSNGLVTTWEAVGRPALHATHQEVAVKEVSLS